MAPKYIIIGIDGGTFDVINQLIEKGELPNISALMQDGVYGNLQSVFPPITPTAWASFLTGVNPGKHGVFDFLTENDAGKTTISNYGTIRSETLFSILGRNGFRIGSIAVPMTYPPPDVNGYVVSGFPVPNNQQDITSPAKLKMELERLVGYYDTDVEYGQFDLNTPSWEKFDALLARLYWLTNKQHKCALYLLENKAWDIFFTVFSLTDRVQHFFWKFFWLSLSVNGIKLKIGF